MRGRKRNREFIENYIDESIKLNYTTLQSISQRAKDEINEIEIKIKELFLLQERRANLLDVIQDIKIK